MTLFWRIFTLNAAVLTVATVVLLVSPVTVSARPVLAESLVLAGELAAMLVANAGLLRIGLAPLDRLTRTMSTVDLLHPGTRLQVTGRAGIAALIRNFYAMLDRLEAERATSAARALSAQEAERRRIAQELHDEIGQTRTAVLLDLKRVAGQAPPPVHDRPGGGAHGRAGGLPGPAAAGRPARGRRAGRARRPGRRGAAPGHRSRRRRA